MELTELIARAPWREAVTYRDTWPHEYVVIKKDKQQELLDAVCKRFCAGEGVDGRFFRMKNKYLFIGDYKYWLMTPCDKIDLEESDYVLNRALIYRDRRDFLIKDGDNGRRDREIDRIFGIDAGEKHMATEELGKLEGVDARTIWPHEALNFTPWLAKNLNLLGEILHLDLERVREEAQVGDFSLDILATDGSGAMVAIENQLAETDHSHLGQLLTYAAGYDVRILIWVTPNFRDEHRAALDWLNRWTPEDIEIYGVEVSAVKIGDSKSAPVFTPVVLPNAWSKREKAKTSGLRPDSFKRQEFFQPLVDILRTEGFTERQQALSSADQRFPSGISSIDYHVSLEGGRKVWVYIPGWPKDFKQPIFDKLRADREDIENDLKLESDSDTQMDWDVPRTGTIGVWRDGSMDDPEEELEEIRQWMFDYLLKFKKVFNPRMERIVSELQAADGEQAEGSADINESKA